MQQGGGPVVDNCYTFTYTKVPDGNKAPQQRMAKALFQGTRDNEQEARQCTTLQRNRYKYSHRGGRGGGVGGFPNLRGELTVSFWNEGGMLQ